MSLAMMAKPTDPTASLPGDGGPARFGPAVRLPLGPIIGGMLGAGIAGGVLAGLVGMLAAPGADLRGVALGTIVVVAGIAISSVMLGIANRAGRQIFSWAALIIAGSMVRMVASLALAIGLFLATQPALAPYFAAFVVGSLAALAAETVLTRRALLSHANIGRAHSRRPSSTEPA